MNDRDYHRQDRQQGAGPIAQLTPVVKWLLFLNLGIFLVDLFWSGSVHDSVLNRFGAFTIDSAIFGGRIWRFLTFQFLHGSFGHVLFNCIGIFFFGPWLERWWGAKKFIIFYLLCGCGGAAFFTLLVLLGILPGNGFGSPLIGASAGIYGIFIGVAVIAPNLRVALLIPPIELSMRQLAIALMVISTGAVLLKLGGNEGGEAGHLGGAILGFLIMKRPGLLGRGRVEVRPPATVPRPLSKLRPRTAVELDHDSAVDKILDKISREGFQSLTAAEREFLQKASDRHQTPR